MERRELNTLFTSQCFVLESGCPKPIIHLPEMVDTATSGSLVIPVRLIRSFEYRNIQHIVLKDVSPSLLGREFLDMVLADIKTRSGLPPPFKKFQYDTLKIEHKAHGAKTSDPVINTEKDEVLLVELDKSLSANGIENETQLSLFKMDDYQQYKECKVVKW